MDDINSFVSTELLEDIFAQLKSSNLTQLLRRKYKKDEFVYYGLRIYLQLFLQTKLTNFSLNIPRY